MWGVVTVWGLINLSTLGQITSIFALATVATGAANNSYNAPRTIGDQVPEDVLPRGIVADYRWSVFRFTGDVVSSNPKMMFLCHDRVMRHCASLQIRCHDKAFSARDVTLAGGRQLRPQPDGEDCSVVASVGDSTDCDINSTISTQPHLSEYTSFDMGLMAGIDRDGVAPEYSALTRRAAITVEAVRAEGVKVKLIALGSQLQSEGVKILAPMGFERYGAYISSTEVLQVQGQNILPFSLQHQTFLLSVLADTHDEFFLGEQYCRIASVVEDRASMAVTVELVFNRLPDSVPLEKGLELARTYIEGRFYQQQMPVSISFVSSTPLPGESPKDQFAAIVGDKYMRQYFPEGTPWYQHAMYSSTAVIAVLGIMLWLWLQRRKQAATVWYDKLGKSVGNSSDGDDLLSQWKLVPSQELAELQRADGKVHMQLIPHKGVSEQLELQMCKRPDGTDWLLGVGGYAKVYKGKKTDGQEVAVKVLHNTDKTRLDMFTKEVRLLESVNNHHPGIVQFLGACLQQNLAVIVLEYMEGGDLHEALDLDSTAAAEGLMTWYHQGANIALDIARALAFLHSRKIAHRDVKSKNVLLSKGRATAKIADVGLSRVLDSLAFSSATIPYGTFTYAAPEVLLGYQCTEKVDMYSFGVVLWEVITHQRAYRGQLRELQVPQECPRAVAHLQDACLHQDPRMRPSAAEAAQQIQQAIHDHDSAYGEDAATEPA